MVELTDETREPHLYQLDVKRYVFRILVWMCGALPRASVGFWCECARFCPVPLWVSGVNVRGSAPRPARGLDPLTPRLASKATELDASLGIKPVWREDDHRSVPQRGRM